MLCYVMGPVRFIKEGWCDAEQTYIYNVPRELVPVRRLRAFACVCVWLRAYPGRTDGVARVVARVVATIYPNHVRV